MLAWLKKYSLIHQIKTLIERNDAMLQNLDALKTSLDNCAAALASLTAAQTDATNTAVKAAVNTALADSQAQVDALVTAAQGLEKSLTDAVAAAKA